MTSQNAGMLARKLAESLQGATIPPSDVAAVQLARRYAQLLDEARNGADETKIFGDLGPKYLATLTALGLTLAGRPAVKGGVPVVGTSKRDELKDRRRARANRAASTNTTAS